MSAPQRWRNPRIVSFAAAVPRFLDGSDTPRHFLERCLETVDRHESVVKAFVRMDVAAARGAADAATARYRAGHPLSPVDGCPLGVKDIMDTVDFPTEMGSALFAGWQPSFDAACVHALRRGGAVIVGKTVTTEFACGGPGATTNPFDAGRTPGGSSSGSAAAVASGMLPVALGTQTQGSTLRPASFCGVVGFKPTHGVLPMAGVHPISATHDHLGVIGGTLADTWRTASHVSLAAGSPGRRFLQGASVEPPPAKQPRKLVRLHTAGWDEVDAPTRATFEATMDDLRRAGVVIASREDDPAVAEFERMLDDGYAQRSLDITAFEMLWPYEQYVARHGDRVIQRIRDRIARAREMSPADYEARLAEKVAMRERAARLLADADGFVTLAASGPAPRGLEHTGSRAFLVYATFLGLPAFSLPVMAVAELPVGLQLIGGWEQDGALCSIARWIDERLAPQG